MVDLVAGGNDINSVMADALGLLVKSSGVGTLLSIFGKMTLDVMQTPIREQIQDWQNQDINDINERKFNKLSDFRNWIQRMKNNVPFFSEEYDFKDISYDSMQSLLNGKIRKWKELKTGYNEVTIFYRYISNQDIFIVDSFFINVNNVVI